ncbi:MAG: DUF1735 domain-containing protein, partial [Alistipes sp.]|nr:DUF1735 domain-containing protein [Alistipes sp.]
MFLAAAAVFTACQGFEDHTIIIEAPAKLAYVNPNSNVHSTRITHTPYGSTYTEIDVKIPALANSTQHERTVANFTVDPSLVEIYNQENGTGYNVMPDGYVVVENTTGLIIPDGSITSTDSLRIYLSGDLSSLNDPDGYILALRLTTESGIETSSVYNTVYIVVNTSFNMFLQNPGASDITGTLVADRSGWNCSGDTEMFDGSTTTYYSFAQNTGHIIALGQNYSIGALRFFARNGTSSTYRPTTYVVQYSTDNSKYHDMGTATSQYIYVDSGYQHIVLGTPVTAAFLKVTVSGASTYLYSGMAEFDIYAE